VSPQCGHGLHKLTITRSSANSSSARNARIRAHPGHGSRTMSDTRGGIVRCSNAWPGSIGKG
jgi:hypothetical protein